jgi:biotin transport system substrate-specific component
MMMVGALFVCLTAAGAHVRIPILPVPITLQTFFVLISGAILGPYYGGFSMAVYVGLGLMGLPVFAGASGLAVITGPTFGYLAAFPFAAFWIGLRLRWKSSDFGSFWKRFQVFWEGTLIIYLCGLVYLYAIRNLYWSDPPGVSTLILAGMAVFLPGDLVKIGLASWLLPRLASLNVLSAERRETDLGR